VNYPCSANPDGGNDHCLGGLLIMRVSIVFFTIGGASGGSCLAVMVRDVPRWIKLSVLGKI